MAEVAQKVERENQLQKYNNYVIPLSQPIQVFSGQSFT